MLAEWSGQGLINREQARQIILYEESKSHSSWVIYGFLVLGASVVGLGIISLIAANWQGLSDEIKLLWDFLLLFFVAKGVYWAKIKDRPILFEALLVLFLILILASIGLIAQIFHTGGSPWQALLLWSFITAPVAATSRRALVPFVWTGGFVSALVDSSIQSHPPLAFMLAIPIIFILRMICQRMGGRPGQIQALNVWILIFFIISLLVAETYRDTPPSTLAFVPGYVLMAFMAWCIYRKHEYSTPSLYALLSAMVLYLIPFHIPLLTDDSLVYALGTLAVLIAATIFFSSIQSKRLFHIFLVMTGVRFLVLYFQALGGLAMTGWGLIIGGFLIILMVMAWRRWSPQ